MSDIAVSESGEGPVMTLITKRLRALRKKQNRFHQLEQSLSLGKPLNFEQQLILDSKPDLSSIIEELEKLKTHIQIALSQELDTITRPRVSQHETLEDLASIMYFGNLFNWKSQAEYASTMLTRSHERECCLTYDTVTDDNVEMLGQSDLDLISYLGGLLISRPPGSSLSHREALKVCVEHARLWLEKSDRSIDDRESSVTYAGLRERLQKIMGSHYFTKTPEIKAPSDVTAAAENYGSFQIDPSTEFVEVEESIKQYSSQDEATEHEGHESPENEPNPAKERHKDELEIESPTNGCVNPLVVTLEQNQGGVESKERQNVTEKNHQSQRGGRSGVRKVYYSNGRGGNRGGGSYQNGRNQYYEQAGNYYPRHYYNNKGRGGRGGGGQTHYNNNNGPAPNESERAYG